MPILVRSAQVPERRVDAARPPLTTLTRSLGGPPMARGPLSIPSDLRRLAPRPDHAVWRCRGLQNSARLPFTCTARADAHPGCTGPRVVVALVGPFPLSPTTCTQGGTHETQDWGTRDQALTKWMVGWEGAMEGGSEVAAHAVPNFMLGRAVTRGISRTLQGGESCTRGGGEAGLRAGSFSLHDTHAFASADSSGTYSLPSGRIDPPEGCPRLASSPAHTGINPPQRFTLGSRSCVHPAPCFSEQPCRDFPRESA